MTASRAVVAALCLVTASRALATPAGDAALFKILMENIQQTGQMTEQIQSMKKALDTARENTALIRSVYAGYEELKAFDAQHFLQYSKQEFLSRNTVIGETTSFAEDLQNRGIHGGTLDVDLIRQRAKSTALFLKCQKQLDEVRSKTLASVDPSCEHFGYDTRTAMSVAADTQAALANPASRLALSQAAVPASPTEGIFSARVMASDPYLYAQLLRQRALARRGYDDAEEIENQLRLAGYSPGAAQQAAAKAVLLSNKQLADLNENNAQLLGIARMEQADRDTAAAQAKLRDDSTAKDIEAGIDAAFAPRALPKQPSLSDK